MFRRLCTLLASAAVAAGVLLGVATPALAYSGCGANSFCVWGTSTTFPRIEREAVDAPPGQNFSMTPPANYVQNTSGYRWYVYPFSNCSGTVGIIYPHSAGAMSTYWANNMHCYERTTLTH